MQKKLITQPNNEPENLQESNIIPGEVEAMLADFKEVPIIEEQISDENDENGKVKTRRKKDKKVINSSIISGALFLLFIDLVIPNLITLINNKVSKKKISAEMLKLSTDQRKELEPLAEEVAATINLKGNPTTVLVLSLGAIYLSNFMLLKGTQK
jgi:hypothetical protein